MENNNQYQYNQQSNNQYQEMNQQVKQNNQQNTNKKRKYMYIAGPLILLIALVGVTYAFFNYTRTGLVNNIGTGRIYFNSTQGNTLYLTNMFPMASSEVSNANLDSIIINIVGDTTYNNGQEFEISLVDVNNTIVSGSTEKAIPINYVATYEATPVATGESPNVIGTSSNDYFNDRGSTTAVYKLNGTGTVTEGEQVLIGYIPANVGINGTLTIKAYLDGSSIAISDTYPSGDVTHIETSGEATSEVLDYTDGTTSEWANGRTVLTTTEWNSLQNTPISFKIKATAQEGIWVAPTIPTCPGCKFMYTTNAYNYGGANNANSTLVSTLTGVTNDYRTLNKNYFLGFTEANGKIDRAFACGIKGENPNQGTVFCIEGTTDGSNYTSISSFLNPLYGPYDSGTNLGCYDYDSYVSCNGAVSARVYNTGNVDVNSDYSHCYVNVTGLMNCY